jgi:hypothetical protein
MVGPERGVYKNVRCNVRLRGRHRGQQVAWIHLSCRYRYVSGILFESFTLCECRYMPVTWGNFHHANIGRLRVCYLSYFRRANVGICS